MATRAESQPSRAAGVATRRPIAVYYEHPRWFEPMFAEMDRRGLPHVKMDAASHQFDIDPAEHLRYGLVFNRMSPSAWTRGHANGIFYTLSYLGHLEQLGVRVINGSRAFRMETSKALQLSLLHALGLPYPRARVINDPAQAPSAARGLRFPVVVKPNIGGSGAGIVRFDAPQQLEAAAREGGISLGLDATGLVQEFIPARGGHITRVETLGYSYLYGINVFTEGQTFDLCPADICRTTDGQDLAVSCVVEGAKAGLRVEGYEPPAEIRASVERIFRAAEIEVGGLEYVIDDRDGQIYYYDVNALSNFVSDGPRVVGFDPFERLVDYLEREAR